MAGQAAATRSLGRKSSDLAQARTLPWSLAAQQPELGGGLGAPRTGRVPRGGAGRARAAVGSRVGRCHAWNTSPLPSILPSFLPRPARPARRGGAAPPAPAPPPPRPAGAAPWGWRRVRWRSPAGRRSRTRPWPACRGGSPPAGTCAPCPAAGRRWALPGPAAGTAGAAAGAGPGRGGGGGGRAAAEAAAEAAAWRRLRVRRAGPVSAARDRRHRRVTGGGAAPWGAEGSGIRAWVPGVTLRGCFVMKLMSNEVNPVITEGSE